MNIQSLPRRPGVVVLFLLLSISTVAGQTRSQETSSGNGNPTTTEREEEQNTVKKSLSRIGFKRWGLSLHGGIGYSPRQLQQRF